MKNLHKLINFAVYDIPRDQLSRAKFGLTGSRLFRQDDDPDYIARLNSVPRNIRPSIKDANTYDIGYNRQGIRSDPGYVKIASSGRALKGPRDSIVSQSTIDHYVNSFKLNGKIDWNKVFESDPYSWQYLQLVTNNPNNNKYTKLLLDDWDKSCNSLATNMVALRNITDDPANKIDPRSVVKLYNFLYKNNANDAKNQAILEDFWKGVDKATGKVNSTGNADLDVLYESLRREGTTPGSVSEKSEMRSLNNAKCLYILSKINSDADLKNKLKEKGVNIKDVYAILDNVFDGHIYDSTNPIDKTSLNQLKDQIRQVKEVMAEDNDINRGSASFAKYLRKKSRDELNQSNQKLADQLTTDMKNSLYNKELSGLDRLLAYGQFNKKVGMQDGRVSKLVGTRPKAQDDRKVAEYLAQSMSNAELNEVIKSIGMDDKIDIIVGYANTNHAKLDDKFRKMIGYPDKEKSFFGYKLQVSKDPFENKMGLRTRNLNDDRVLREKLSVMSKYDIDKVLKHINENSDKDPSTAVRITEAAKVLNKEVKDFIDMYTVGMKFFSYVFILDPKNPLVRFNKFLKSLKKIYENFNKAKENIVKFQQAFI